MLTARYPYVFAPHHAEWEARARAFSAEGSIRDRVDALGRAGLLRAPDVRALALARWHLAHRDPLTDLAFVIQELGTFPLVRAGGFDDVVEEAKAGRSVVAFALTEPEAGSDVRNVSTVAVKHGDTYRLTGLKHFISNAPECDRAVVFAKLDEAVACFLVDRPETEAQDVSGHSIGRVILRDTPARLVSPKGLALAFGTLERCRPSVGAAALGMARRAIDETVTHVSTRRQFGAPLSQLQLVQARVAEMALQLDATLPAVLHACWRRDHASAGERTGYDSAVAKVAATEAAQRVVDTAVQLHGGRGVEADSVVQRLYRDIRPLRIYEGATDVLLTVIAAHWLEEK